MGNRTSLALFSSLLWLLGCTSGTEAETNVGEEASERPNPEAPSPDGDGSGGSSDNPVAAAGGPATTPALVSEVPSTAIPDPSNPSDLPNAAGSANGGSANGGSTSGNGGVANAGAGATSTAAGAAGRDANGGAPSPSGGNGPSPASAGGAGAAGVPAVAEWDEAFPTFTRHEVADFPSGYYVTSFDVDGDTLSDIVALSSGTGGLVWFKNPTWDEYTITNDASRLICMDGYDVDGDGDTDVAFVSDFDMNDSTSGGSVQWAEAPEDPASEPGWALHPIGAAPTSHRLKFGDIDGDGIKELLDLPIFGVGSTTPTRAGAVELTAYSIPSDPAGAWEKRVLDDSRLEVAHGLTIVDWDGDAAADVLTAANDGIDLFRPALDVDPLNLAVGAEGQGPDRGSSEVGLGALGTDRFLATIEPWHGTDAVIYTPGASENAPWTRRVLGSDFVHGHGLVTVDLNGDGYDEVVAGGGQGDLAQLIYRYVPSTDSWETIELDVGGVAVSAIVVDDLNGDGRSDIVTIGGSPTDNVVWYENTP